MGFHFDVDCVTASAVGKHLKTANPINVPRQHHRLCNCTGKMSVIISGIQ